MKLFEKAIVLLSIATLFFAGCKKEEEEEPKSIEPSIEYPRIGHYGTNILDTSLYNYTGGGLQYGSFSLKADLRNNAGLKLIIHGADTGLWVFNVGSIQNWAYNTIDLNNVKQEFKAVDPNSNCDLKISFVPGTYRIDYYEFYSDTITHRKQFVVVE